MVINSLCKFSFCSSDLSKSRFPRDTPLPSPEINACLSAISDSVASISYQLGGRLNEKSKRKKHSCLQIWRKRLKRAHENAIAVILTNTFFVEAIRFLNVCISGPPALSIFACARCSRSRSFKHSVSTFCISTSHLFASLASC